ncbi:LysR family transcriptional regulator [Verticiella sediminum]|uniref:LysR family transcriptional regulator n=1 Tax=Verticiella sediminum TaxID=1247510 RepID=A0A556AXF0_9BURK|nr:LysR family transcriptional regulator [Verticiella sediminum]TSH97610.1 LysR family transcriptional regulator [Verticiella sediminum]
MDLNLIRLFVGIVEAGSMSEAARRLGITRSHVSRRVQALERDLGSQLIRRTTRRIDLTADGQTLYEHAQRMLQELEQARAKLHEAHGAPRGHVRVSLPTGLAAIGLSAALAEFVRAQPGLTLRLLLSNRVADLVDAEIDVAVRVLAEPPADAVVRHRQPVRWRLCCTPAYLQRVGGIQAPEDLARCAVIWLPAVRRARELALRRDGRRWTVPLRPVLESEDFPVQAQAMRSGLGVALLPSYLLADDLAQGRIVTVLDDYLPDHAGDLLCVLTTRNPYPSTAIRAVVDYLREWLDALPAIEPAGRPA